MSVEKLWESDLGRAFLDVVTRAFGFSFSGPWKLEQVQLAVRNQRMCHLTGCGIWVDPDGLTERGHAAVAFGFLSGYLFGPDGANPGSGRVSLLSDEYWLTPEACRVFNAYLVVMCEATATGSCYVGNEKVLDWGKR